MYIHDDASTPLMKYFKKKKKTTYGDTDNYIYDPLKREAITSPQFLICTN